MKRIFGMFLDMVQEEPFDAALVQNNLFETGETNWYVGYTVGSPYYAIFAWILARSAASTLR